MNRVMHNDNGQAQMVAAEIYTFKSLSDKLVWRVQGAEGADLQSKSQTCISTKTKTIVWGEGAPTTRMYQIKAAMLLPDRSVLGS